MMSRQRLSGLLVFAFVCSFVVTLSDVAQAIPVTVRVTIERVRAIGGWPDEDADFYAFVTIDGQEFDNEDTPSTESLEDNDDISPTEGWEFSRPVDHTRGTVPVSIEIRDEDDFLRLDDDLADVDPTDGTALDLSVKLVPCSIAGGDITGTCGSTLTAEGTDDGDGPAQIQVRIDVTEPTSAPGFHISCIHGPIWPQPINTVTVTASALDGGLAPNKLVDKIQIWVNDPNDPNDEAAPVSEITGGTTLSVSLGPFSGPTFSYRCLVVDSDLAVPISTGWRTVSIGTPAAGRAVPVIFTGPRSSRIDIAFIPDKDNYTGPTDSRFDSDVGTMIRAYYGEDIFLRNQDKFNFWVALDSGDAQEDCKSTPPDNWDSDYTFIDSGAVTHRGKIVRDCAPGGDRFFSGDTTRRDPKNTGRLGRVFLHETGHRPFGLADEYCCDGGYYQVDPFPNVYEEPEDCTDDAKNLGKLQTACREFEEVLENWDDFDWSVSDPSTDDLMNDNLTAQAADIRRMNWMFEICMKAGC